MNYQLFNSMVCIFHNTKVHFTGILGCYMAKVGSLLPTFCDNLSARSQTVQTDFIYSVAEVWNRAQFKDSFFFFFKLCILLCAISSRMKCVLCLMAICILFSFKDISFGLILLLFFIHTYWITTHRLLLLSVNIP